MSDEELAPTLDASDLAALDRLGRRRAVAPGEYLYRDGDAAYDFFAVVSGEVEISAAGPDGRHVVARHGPGRFLGELNLLTGLRVFVSARVVEAGEVIQVPAEAFRHLVATQPALSDRILAAFMARRSGLLSAAAGSIRVIGSRFARETGAVREFLARNRIPHEWLDPDRDRDVDAVLRGFSIAPGELPVVIATGSVLRRPTPGALAQYLGLTIDSLPGRCFDLVVVGGGPGGLAAAVYGASEGLRTLGVDSLAVGGQASRSSRIENYLGFPTGISGADLTQRAAVQAEKFGARLTSPCAATGLHEQAGHLVVRLSDGTHVAGRAVIAATGARYRRLEAERLEDFECKGVYYAATEIEARQCSAAPVVVAGGGNSAGQAALFLAESGSPVTVVIRGPDLNAGMSRYLVDRIDADDRIDVRLNTKITCLDGGETLSAVRLAGGHGEETLACAGLFSFIGADPASDWLSGCAALDDRGFVLTDRALSADDLDGRWAALGRPPLPFETSHPGLFAVGDLRSGSTKRVAAAVGEGSAAVRSVHEHLAFAH
ncbi:MAG TPA: FAD-dependent oxidoreductase [Acidimicrobiales bacterium]|nr:FAD-dependent oxidoreductase [Acidimicrobiales bacterium]